MVYLIGSLRGEKMYRSVRALWSIVALVAVQGCGRDPVEVRLPNGTDVDAAHTAWVSNHPDSYIFDVAISSSWVPPTPYYRVTVAGGRVIAATDAKGGAVSGFETTIDSIWKAALCPPRQQSTQLGGIRFSRRTHRSGLRPVAGRRRRSLFRSELLNPIELNQNG